MFADMPTAVTVNIGRKRNEEYVMSLLKPLIRILTCTVILSLSFLAGHYIRYILGQDSLFDKERILKMENIFNYISVPIIYTILGGITGLCLYLLFDR